MSTKINLWVSRVVVFVFYHSIRFFGLLSKKQAKTHGGSILLTGTFYSKNWVEAHLLPLYRSRPISKLIVVANKFDYQMEGVMILKPPALFVRLVGNSGARLITFAYCALKFRPDYIGGFHLLFNATVAILLANMIGARSIYFCVGGITETLVSGKTENKFFHFLRKKDPFLTNYLCRISAYADNIITMGHGAKKYFVETGISPEKISVISGAIDHHKFMNSTPDGKPYDIVLAARLTPVKQVDLYIDIIENILKKANIKALVVGDGPLRLQLETYAKIKSLGSNICFAGHQDDVNHWLNQARIYILTSRSEGLALSMMEALTCGLPAVVPNVGDLSDALIDGYNGYLIANHSVDDFSDKILYLLNNSNLLNQFSNNAILSSKKFDLPVVIEQWDQLFGSLSRKQVV